MLFLDSQRAWPYSWYQDGYLTRQDICEVIFQGLIYYVILKVCFLSALLRHTRSTFPGVGTFTFSSYSRLLYSSRSLRSFSWRIKRRLFLLTGGFPVTQFRNSFLFSSYFPNSFFSFPFFLFIMTPAQILPTFSPSAPFVFCDHIELHVPCLDVDHFQSVPLHGERNFGVRYSAYHWPIVGCRWLF